MSYKVLALVSGGKDSCYSMIQCVAAGHTIVGLANLRPNDEEAHELDSYMYQTVGHTAISLYAEAMALPLFRGLIKRTSLATSSNDYSPTDGDEVEDLYDLLADVKTKLDFNAVCSGAILSDYQRIRVENVCSRLGLVSLGYLWRRDQSELLDEMLDDGKLEAIIVKVATLGLDQSHLGKTLAEIRPHLHKMNTKYGINVCGEGGEYETFTLDCPLFYKALVLEESEVNLHSDDAFAPVAFLKLKSIQLRDKNVGPFSSQHEMLSKCGATLRTPDFFATLTEQAKEDNRVGNQQDDYSATIFSIGQFSALTSDFFRVDKTSGFFSVANLHATSLDPIEATKETFAKLKELLSSAECSLSDLASVTLLVGDMSQYGHINAEYVRHFKSNPPVRVCVQANIDFPLLMSAIGRRRIKDDVYNDRELEDGDLKRVMHVQSISHWAPANIGPYSQVVEVGGLVFVAGQIGLVPGSMTLASGIENQARLGLRHLARVLDVFNCSTRDIVQVVCYVTANNFSVARNIWMDEMSNQAKSDARPHLICVEVPRLPRDALVEWHVVAASDKNLDFKSKSVLKDGFKLDQTWITTDSGLTFISAELSQLDDIEANLSKAGHFLRRTLEEEDSNGILSVYLKDRKLSTSFQEIEMQTTFVPVSRFARPDIILAWTVLLPCKN